MADHPHSEPAPVAPARRRGRHTRLWLLALLVVAAVFAASALFAKGKLDTLRAAILRAAESKTGVQLQIGSVSGGLRGLRLAQVVAAVDLPSGPSIQVSAPQVSLSIDLMDLLYGELTIRHLQVDHGTIQVLRPPNQPWLAPETGLLKQGSSVVSKHPFRVVGTDCTLEVQNVVGDTRLLINDLAFDVSRLSDSSEVAAKVSGNLSASPDKRLQVDLRLASLNDFNLRMNCSEISADDVNVFLPASRRLVESGVAHPTIRLDGYPDKRLVVSIETPFENVLVRDQPSFLEAAEGTLAVLGRYDYTARLLTLEMAKADTAQLAGTLDGTISFAQETPEFDLRVALSRLPVAELIDTMVRARTAEYGAIELTLDEPNEVGLTLSGTTEQPQIAAKISAPGGELSFQPKRKDYPEGSVRLGRMEASWTPESRGGSFAIVDGSIRHKTGGVTAESMSGILTIQDNLISLAPLTALVKGQPFIGSATFDLATKEGAAAASGVLSGIEETPLAHAIKNTELAGSVTVNATGKFTSDKWDLEGDVDATQTDVAYEWWLRKPPGIGASGKIKTVIVPRRTIEFRADATVASSDFHAVCNYVFKAPRWSNTTSKLSSASLDIVSVGKCLQLPYRITGGTGTDARYDWARDDSGKFKWLAETQFKVDDLTFQANGTEYPCHLKDVAFVASFNRALEVPNPPERATGTMKVVAREAAMGPLKSKWSVPMAPDEEYRKKHPEPDAKRDWTYALSAKSISLPPWKGTGFASEAYTNDTESGFHSFGGDIEGGRLDGSYRSQKAENAYELNTKWSKVPANYFLEYMNLPPILVGKMSGEVVYSQDRDDPGTLNGKGFFEIHDGQFSADFLLSRFDTELAGNASALPPSLKFSLLRADVGFEKDLVKTPSLELDSAGLHVKGSGHFVSDGDMDYEVQVAIAPEVAERIPVLRDNFNVEGHRMTSQSIDLAFHITGPTQKPKGELAQTPPVSVTLVSGVASVTGDAFKVIDTPRKILVDLLKLGGGIVGIRKPPSG